VKIGDNEIIVTGHVFKTGTLGNEWLDHVEDPETIIKKLRSNNSKADIFTFWQGPPEATAKYDYYKEFQSYAVLRISSFDYWCKNQINRGAKRAIQNAQKSGIVAESVDFSNELVKGIVCIAKETPIRQGRPYSHYGEDFETAKQKLSEDLDRCEFIGAYYQNELIGFIKLGFGVNYAVPFGMVSKIEHRDKSPQNLLLAKAVEVCAKRGVPYLIYGFWGSGSLNEFKRHIGCERMDLPRYYIPLNVKGRLALKLRLHHSIREMLPNKLRYQLSKLRSKWYARQENNLKSTRKKDRKDKKEIPLEDKSSN
jgi:hypothetical protein